MVPVPFVWFLQRPVCKRAVKESKEPSSSHILCPFVFFNVVSTKRCCCFFLSNCYVTPSKTAVDSLGRDRYFQFKSAKVVSNTARILAPAARAEAADCQRPQRRSNGTSLVFNPKCTHLTKEVRLQLQMEGIDTHAGFCSQEPELTAPKQTFPSKREREGAFQQVSRTKGPRHQSQSAEATLKARLEAEASALGARDAGRRRVAMRYVWNRNLRGQQRRGGTKIDPHTQRDANV